MDKKLNKNILSNNRFFYIKRLHLTWIYDSYTNSIYSIKNLYFNALINSKKEKLVKNTKEYEKIKRNILLLKDIIPISKKSEKDANVMINISNHCNLKCSYCYRNKNDNSSVSVEQVEYTIKEIINRYKKESKCYNFTFSMTSESSLDLPILKKIALVFDEFENYFLTSKDFINNNLKKIYAKLKKLEISDFVFPKFSNENTISILNELIKRRDLIKILNINEEYLQDFLKKEIQKVNELNFWKLHRVNRWLIEYFLDGYLKSSSEKYCSFNFFTNGTNASKEYIDFIKGLDKDTLMISIDGKKQVHDQNRSNLENKGSFKLIKENIKIFKNNGLKLKATSTITRKYPYPDRIINQIKKLGFISCEQGLVRENSNVSLLDKDLPKLFKSYRKIYKKIYRTLLLYNFEYFKFIIHDPCVTPLLSILKGSKIIKRCDIDNQFVIDINGDVYDCLYFCSKKTNKIGNIYTGINYNKEKYSFLKVTNRTNCISCWARYLCGGTCFYNSKCLTNSYNHNSPIECKIKKFYAEECIKLLVKLRSKNFDLKKLLYV